MRAIMQGFLKLQIHGLNRISTTEFLWLHQGREDGSDMNAVALCKMCNPTCNITKYNFTRNITMCNIMLMLCVNVTLQEKDSIKLQNLRMFSVSIVSDNLTCLQKT